MVFGVALDVIFIALFSEPVLLVDKPNSRFIGACTVLQMVDWAWFCKQGPSQLKVDRVT